MWKGWIAGAVALVGIFAWLGQDESGAYRLCVDASECEAGEHCHAHRCEPLPPPERFTIFIAGKGEGSALCGDGICDLSAGECGGACPEDCPDVPCSLPCTLDGVCSGDEGPGCPDCFPAGCNFDGLCTVGESPRCPDCSCRDAYCDTAAGECVETCPEDCPGTRCEPRCDFDAHCEPGESDGCPDCTCGDGVCDPALEDCSICAFDCGPCADGCEDGSCTDEDCPDCIPDPCGEEGFCPAP